MTSLMTDSPAVLWDGLIESCIMSCRDALANTLLLLLSIGLNVRLSISLHKEKSINSVCRLYEDVRIDQSEAHSQGSFGKSDEMMEWVGFMYDQSEQGNVDVWVGSVWEHRGWGVGDRKQEAGALQAIEGAAAFLLIRAYLNTLATAVNT